MAPLPDEWYLENWPGLNLPAGRQSLIEAFRKIGMRGPQAEARANSLHRLAIQDKTKRSEAFLGASPDIYKQFHTIDRFGSVTPFGFATEAEYEAFATPIAREQTRQKAMQEVIESSVLTNNPVFKGALGFTAGVLDAGRAGLSAPFDLLQGLVGWTGLDFPEEVAKAIREDQPDKAFAGLRLALNASGSAGEAGYTAGQLYSMVKVAQAVRAGLGPVATAVPTIGGISTSPGLAIAEQGIAGLLLTPGSASERGTGALIGAVGGAAGAGLQAVAGRLLHPRLVAPVAAVIEKRGFTPPEAAAIAGSVLPHITGLFTGAAGFSIAEAPFLPDDPDINLGARFLHNLTSLAVMTAARIPQGRRAVQGLKNLRHIVPGESLNDPQFVDGLTLARRAVLAEQTAKDLLLQTVSATPTGTTDPRAARLAGPNSLTLDERKTLKAVIANNTSPGLPAMWVAVAGALARRGIPLSVSQARSIVGEKASRLHDLEAKLLGSDLVRQADELMRELTEANARSRVRIDDETMRTEAAGEALTGESYPRDLEADILTGGLLGTEAYGAANHGQRRLMTRFLHLREQFNALRESMGLTADEVTAKWNAGLLNDLDFLQTYALFLEGTGTIAPPQYLRGPVSQDPAKPAAARELIARRFLARLPRASEELLSLLADMRAPVSSLSEAVAAIRLVAAGVSTVAESGFFTGPVRNYVERLQADPLLAKEAKRALPEIERLAQQAARARKLPEFFLVFRSGPLDRRLPATAVSLDPRAAIARGAQGIAPAFLLDNLYGGESLTGLGVTRVGQLTALTPGNTLGVEGFGVYIVPRGAVKADLETLMRSHGALETIAELHVDPRQMVPVADIKFPSARADMAQAMKIFPPMQRDLDTLARTQKAMERTAVMLARTGQPVAWINKTPVLQMTFLAQPDPAEGRPLSAVIQPTDVKGAQEALRAFQKAYSEGTDPVAALMDVFRTRLHKAVSKDVAQQKDVLAWALAIQRWYGAPEAARLHSRPPAPPEGVADPLFMVAKLRAVFGDDLEGARRASLNVVGKGSAGQALLQHPDALVAAEAALEAYRTNTWIDPIDQMGRTPHARSELSAIDLGGPPMPNLVSAAQAVVDNANRIKDLLPAEIRDEADGMIAEALAPLSSMFVRPPSWTERAGLAQTSQVLVRVLDKWTDASKTKWDPRLGIAASNALLDSVDKFNSMLANSRKFLLHHETKWRLYLDYSTKGMTEEEAAKFRADANDRIYRLGEKDPDPKAVYHPAELETATALKQVYEGFAEAMEVAGFRPIKDGTYMSRIYKRLSEMAVSSGDREQALRFEKASSRFLRARTRTEAGEDVETDMFEVMRAYVPSMSRALAFSPVAKAFQDIVERHGVKAPEGYSTAFHFGFELPRTFRRNPDGLDWRSVRVLQKATNRMAGIASPLDAAFETGLGYLAKGAFGWNLGKLWDWAEKSPRLIGRDFGAKVAAFSHFLALGGIVPPQLFRNVVGGGLISMSDGGLGARALVRGLKGYVQVDPVTGTVRPDPVVQEILGDDTFVQQLNRNIESNWEVAMGTRKGGAFSEATRFVLTKATVPFGMSEVMIRGAVAKGAYLLGKEIGLSHADAVKYARQVTARSQTNYDAITGASLFGSSAGKFFGQFQRFGWNWFDQLNQKVAATGLFGRARAATALASVGGPEVYASDFRGNTPSFRRWESVRHAASPMGALAMAAGLFAFANVATRHLFGVSIPDNQGVLASAPEPVRALSGAIVRQIVDSVGPGGVEERKARGKAVADALGVDIPAADAASIAASSVGPLPGLLTTPLDLVLRHDSLSPRELAEVMDGWSLVTSPSQVRTILKAADAYRSGYFRSRAGNRIGPSGRSLNPGERLTALFGFTPSSVVEALDSYEHARDVRDWYDDAASAAGDKAKAKLRRGEAGDALAEWIADWALIQEEMGVYRPWKGPHGLKDSWNRLVVEARSGADRSLSERERERFPLDSLDISR